MCGLRKDKETTDARSGVVWPVPPLVSTMRVGNKETDRTPSRGVWPVPPLVRPLYHGRRCLSSGVGVVSRLQDCELTIVSFACIMGLCLKNSKPGGQPDSWQTRPGLTSRMSDVFCCRGRSTVRSSGATGPFPTGTRGHGWRFGPNNRNYRLTSGKGNA